MKGEHTNVMPEHTPGPWRVKSPVPSCSNSKGKVYGPPHPVDGGDYAPIAVFSNHIDAVVAVNAINTHDGLRAACVQAENYLKGDPQFDTIVFTLRAAIAKARGEA